MAFCWGCGGYSGLNEETSWVRREVCVGLWWDKMSKDQVEARFGDILTTKIRSFDLCLCGVETLENTVKYWTKTRHQAKIYQCGLICIFCRLCACYICSLTDFIHTEEILWANLSLVHLQKHRILLGEQKQEREIGTVSVPAVYRPFLPAMSHLILTLWWEYYCLRDFQKARLLLPSYQFLIGDNLHFSYQLMGKLKTEPQNSFLCF